MYGFIAETAIFVDQLDSDPAGVHLISQLLTTILLLF